MTRWKVCLFINLFVCLAANAQKEVPVIQPVTIHINNASPALKPAILPLRTNVAAVHNAPAAVIPANYYTTTIGFFCKKELQMDKAIKFPVGFGLGSVAYTDKMEGKGSGSYRPADKM